MAKVYALDGIVPVIHPTAFVHATAVLIGDVIVGPACFVAPGASLRGDFGRLILEEGANFQDNCTMHGYSGIETVVAAGATVGHGAVIHGARIGRHALVGMNAVVMDGAVIGEHAVVAALAFVKTGFEVPPRSLVAGVPARVLRRLGDAEIAFAMEGARQYQELTRRSFAGMVEVSPLTEVEAKRRRMDEGAAVPRFRPTTDQA